MSDNDQFRLHNFCKLSLIKEKYFYFSCSEDPAVTELTPDGYKLFDFTFKSMSLTKLSMWR